MHSGTLADGLGSFPLATEHYRPAPVSRGPSHRHSEFAWTRYPPRDPHPCSALPPADIPRGRTSIRFGENQLSPSLIGLSPLPTAHPSGFQPTTVRPSTGLYPSFSLAIGRSLRFRVCPHGLLALFRLAFAPAPVRKTLASPMRSNSPDHNAKGTQSPRGGSEEPRKAPTACRHTVSGSLSLASRRSFHLSLTVLVHYRSQSVFSLGGWSPLIQSGLLGPRPTRVSGPSRARMLRLQGSHLVPRTVPGRFGSHTHTRRAPAPSGPLNPGPR